VGDDDKSVIYYLSEENRSKFENNCILPGKLVYAIHVRTPSSKDLMIMGHDNKAQVLYKDEYPQWKERFLGYIKDRPDSESLMKSIIEAPVDIPGRAPSVAHPLGRLIPKGEWD
ncbi:hypothetical protein Tco_1374159, partial [Tanacetum coccineum]